MGLLEVENIIGHPTQWSEPMEKATVVQDKKRFGIEMDCISNQERRAD